ncbi:transglycosylase family protein [Kitasatospora purpeofusca]|uniref:transglycosylase family protein n=1 Tax=Kitasatospora purpeofusca TaxID=67352 RepID=UPI002259FE4A|nr:transglycosylase family protein [Kitasatospora purpeofusca]MCX4759263.1 transglycosylase family protein [Kitasatospora purpeofusca]WSR30338.1 transglycosylase family protein [Kitasatospora purpeofusca]WSR38573.1 transglycosylase family protein [Kitasatospora purpeofusca]
MSRSTRRSLAAAVTFTALAALGLPAVAAGSAHAASVATWDRVAQCESSGDWSYYRAGWPYFGGLQITKGTWEAFGGTQYAPLPHQATKQQQILTAERILAGQGTGAWAAKCNGGLGTDHADPYPAPTAPVSSPGDLFHATRLVDGNWTSFKPLNGFGTAPFFNASQESIAATPDGSTQTLATGSDGNLYHTARYPNGSWTPWAPLDGYAGSPRFSARAQAIAGMSSGDTQIVAVGADGKIYHNARFVSGSWQGWAPVGTWGAQRIAAAGLPDGSLQVLIVGNDGNLYHSIRAVDGSWQGWNAVAGFGADTFQAKDIAVAGMPNGDTQLLAVGNDGKIYHNARFAAGTWQGWNAVAGYGGAAGFQAGSLAITGMSNGDAQMLAVGNDGQVYHNARYSSGSWQGWWNTAFSGRKVSIAGMPDGGAQMVVVRS